MQSGRSARALAWCTSMSVADIPESEPGSLGELTTSDMISVAAVEPKFDSHEAPTHASSSGSGSGWGSDSGSDSLGLRRTSRSVCYILSLIAQVRKR